ncbi:MAG: ion transporter [Flavobacteriales bacterium]|nr:ion transporter [Flavobacteriales bacterium]
MKFAKDVAESKWFQNFIIGIIVAAGVLVGIQTYKSFASQHEVILNLLDSIILWIFVVEIAVKMLAEGSKPWNYFKDAWNVFDFLIVAVCFLPLDGDTSFIAVLRLARILRVFKLVTALPKLQLIVGALLKSIPSMGYVFLLLTLHFYIYGCMATFFYSENDPYHFGDLQMSMLSLFRAVTMEDWTDLMYINMYGSDHYGYSSEMLSHLAEHGVTPVASASPIGAAIFFVTFILTGGMIVLNLFIGVIMTGMDEMKAEAELEAKAKLGDKLPAHEEVLILQKQVEDLSHNLLLLSKKLEQRAQENKI